MLDIDGSDGGGKLLRTALSLAAVTDTSFRIDRIRGSRPNPGLRAQHLAAVELVAERCDADVEGAELGAESLTFDPGDARRSPLEATVDTAGSITLLFDTVLPIAAADDEPLELTATGGTDVKWSPTIRYHQSVKLPMLATWGLEADIDLVKTGFYPAGGGKATLKTVPSSLSRLELDERGALSQVDIYSKAAADLAEQDVADRQAAHARKRLDEMGIPTEIARVDYVPTQSIGSSLLLCATYDHSLAGFDALGERGRTSEDVADDAVESFEAFHAGDAPVDVHMADQLLVFLALAGGTIRIPARTTHVRTNLDLIADFGSDIRSTRLPDGTFRVVASAHPAVR
ncbi:MAG: RNA 3'-terminal phosphate cyclase [Haloplanus sp.]